MGTALIPYREFIAGMASGRDTWAFWTNGEIERLARITHSVVFGYRAFQEAVICTDWVQIGPDKEKDPLPTG